MRALLGMFGALTALPIPGHAQPPIPLQTQFSHWDHHWFMWTPRHPVYEAIEVMARDGSDGRPPLIWSFLTEREGRKKQVNYFNDPVLARRWPGDTHYRDIEYRADGATGAPRDLTVRFRDKDNAPVEWTVTFDPGAVLGTSGAGLTDQSGHSSASLFLIFFREKGAATRHSALRIGGRDFSFRDEDQASGQFGASYSTNVFTATVAYGSTVVENTSDGMRTSTGRVFRRQASSDAVAFTSNALGERNAIRIVSAGKPSGVIIDWRNEQPEWATAYRFTSLLRPTAGQKYELVVAPSRE
jgi:hypothetical protein